MRVCSVEGCGGKHDAKGYCHFHYSRWKRCGDPAGVRLPNGEAHKFLFDTVLSYEGDDCLFWPYTKSLQGYGMIHFTDKKNVTVSRWVCEQTNGAPPSPFHQAAHSCGRGDLACVTKKHLSWKTSAENSADKRVHGTLLQGENIKQAKLNPHIVRKMRNLRTSGLYYSQIAKKFDVTTETARRAITRETWAHVN